MRHLYALILMFLVSCLCALGQKNINQEQLHKIIKNHSYHCDSFLAKFDDYLFHDDLQMNFLFLGCELEGENLRLKGRVGDYTREGMPCAIYLASISDTSCYMEQKIANADLNGNFTFQVPKDPLKSLYWVSTGYHDVEIKISDLILLTNQ